MLIVTAQPTDPPVARDEVLQWLRLRASDLDTGQIAVVDDLLEEAAETIGKATGLTLSETGLEERFAGWPCGRSFELSAAPVRDVSALVYFDEDGAEQSVDGGDWSWEPTPTGAEVRLSDSFTRPSLDCDRPLPVRIRFTVGFDAPGQSESEPRLVLPRLARTALRLAIAAGFDSADRTRGLLTDDVEQVCRGLRIYR